MSALAALIVFCSFVEMSDRLDGSTPAVAEAVDDVIRPFHIVNVYGLFAVMTTERNETVIEGSDDGITWREYGFRYKPGDVMRAPVWATPHQPRLDWQMWFAALGNPQYLPWFWHFLEQLLRNEPTVIGLLDSNPFPDHPPFYIRAQLYGYLFANAADRAKGIWWDRRLLRRYFPEIRLKSP